MTTEAVPLTDEAPCDWCGATTSRFFAPCGSLDATKCLRDQMENERARAESAEQENARLRTALEFYADQTSWRTTGHPQIDAWDTAAIRDGGSRARTALTPSTKGT